ncbi:MAG: YihY/virulence factor BrkB family protein [Pseudomonadota bacterium]
MKLIGKILKSFINDDCFSLASNISFCAILAVIPLMMLMMSVTGFFLGSQAKILNDLVNEILSALPIGQEIFMQNLHAVMDTKSSLGIVGILTLFFIATVLVSAIEKSFDTIFKTNKRRNFFHSRLIGITVIFGVSLLFFIPTVVRIFESLFKHFHFTLPFGQLLTTDFFMFVVAFLAFVVGCVVIPNQKVYIRYAAIGGLVFSIGIGVAKMFFRIYAEFAFAKYNLIYGSFTALILSIMWVYYLSNILLLSAEVVAHIQDKYKGLEDSNGQQATGEK